MNNTIVVSTTTYDIVVKEETGIQTIVTTSGAPTVITAVTAGPQGPRGLTGGALRDLEDVDINGVINNSLLYYNATTQKVTGSNEWTTENITDGGNF
jgi:hypothetical protein